MQAINKIVDWQERVTGDGGRAWYLHADSHPPRTSCIPRFWRCAGIASAVAERIARAGRSHKDTTDLLSRCVADPRAALPKLPPRRRHRADAIRNAGKIHAAVVR